LFFYSIEKLDVRLKCISAREFLERMDYKCARTAKSMSLLNHLYTVPTVYYYFPSFVFTPSLSVKQISFSLVLLEQRFWLAIFSFCNILPPLTVKEERMLRAFENRTLRRIFRSKRDANGHWRRLDNEEFHSLYRSPNTVLLTLWHNSPLMRVSLSNSILVILIFY
jgi:hypothetical protein